MLLMRTGMILLANSFYDASGKEYHKLPACSYCTDISEIATYTFYKGIRQRYHIRSLAFMGVPTEIQQPKDGHKALDYANDKVILKLSQSIQSRALQCQVSFIP